MTLLAALWNKTSAFLLAIAAAIGVFLLALREARRAGIDHVRAEQKEKNDALRKQWDEIDRAPTDVDSALERLRKRSGQ